MEQHKPGNRFWGAPNRRWVQVGIALLLLGICFCGFVLILLNPRAPSIQAGRISIASLGRGTNEAGQGCLLYRVRNENAQALLGLAEFPSAPPGSGLFFALPAFEAQTIKLIAPPAGASSRVQLACFVEDRGVLSRVYAFVQNTLGKRPHPISKLLFTVPGPTVEP